MRSLVVLSFALSAAVASAARTEVVSKVSGLGQGNVTAAFQREIDALAASGGGTLRIPAGEYVVASLRLRSGITLHLERNAFVYGSTNASEYVNYVNTGDNIASVIQAEEAENVAAKAELTPSAAVEAVFGEDAEAKAEYCAKFGFAVVPAADDKWAVEAFLTPEEWTNVALSAQAATWQIPLADIAARELGVPTNVTVVGCVPGFYYSFYSGSTVTNLRALASEASRNVLCGTDGEVKFSGVTKPSDAAGFFTIGVLEVPTAYVAGEDSSPTGIPPYLPGHPPVRH